MDNLHVYQDSVHEGKVGYLALLLSVAISARSKVNYLSYQNADRPYAISHVTLSAFQSTLYKKHGCDMRMIISNNIFDIKF